MINFHTFVAGYKQAIIFAETATNGDGEDVQNLAGYDFSESALGIIYQDCRLFWGHNSDKVGLAVAGSEDYDYERAGNDFWFTRQHHGVGFWDRGLGLVGDELTEAAESFAEKNIFINDAGLLEIE